MFFFIVLAPCRRVECPMVSSKSEPCNTVNGVIIEPGDSQQIFLFYFTDEFCEF